MSQILTFGFLRLKIYWILHQTQQQQQQQFLKKYFVSKIVHD